MNWLKNGFYIPVFHVLSFLSEKYFLLSTLWNQFYTINYFFWFSNHYDFGFPKQYNQLKQLINFTYSGNYAMYLAYFFPTFLPVCHNIQFIITFSYWVGKFFYNCADTDEIYHPEVSNRFVKWWSYAGHIVPYCVCLNEIKKSVVIFDWNSFFYTYLWAYGWLIGIYIPWRSLSGDPVYSILKELPPRKLIEYLITIHIIIGGSNLVGKLLV